MKNPTTDKCRVVSWWITWEDLIYPDKGIEEKILLRAKEYKDAGINTAIICGAHFRWDHIYIWDRLHELLKFTADALHNHGIKLFDHHSAVLVHRPKNLQAKWNIWCRNRHHVPLYPSREIANNITCNGHKIKDFRMINVKTGKPCYVPAYEAEIFCMNNENFRKAYRSYVKRLLSETSIDGLMCDDVIYYPGWVACGCSYCRRKYKKLYSHTLPDAMDGKFWGNMESDAFRDWIEMRYNDSADFLNMVKKETGNNFPLMSCCSINAEKYTNVDGLSACTMSKALNCFMLEMCGEIRSFKKNIVERIPDIMIQNAVASRKSAPSIGMGYAHFPDSAFLIWAFNKLLGTSTWISTLKGRLGIPEKGTKTLPDESGIVGEGYHFETAYPELFKGESAAKTALFFSFETMAFYGDSEDDYVSSFRKITSAMFMKNIQFDVVEDIPSPEKYPVLILCDSNCMSKEAARKTIAYLKGGGTVIASGPVGLRDERGRSAEKNLLSYFGIDAVLKEPGRKVDMNTFFDIWPIQRKVFNACSGKYAGRKLQPHEWLEIDLCKGRFIWLPARCLNDNTVKVMRKKTEQEQSATTFSVECPDGWFYKTYNEGENMLISFFSSNFTAIPDRRFKNQFTGHYLTRAIRYKKSKGLIRITTEFKKGMLYSPDIKKPKEVKTKNGIISFSLENITRYCIIKLT